MRLTKIYDTMLRFGSTRSILLTAACLRSKQEFFNRFQGKSTVAEIKGFNKNMA